MSDDEILDAVEVAAIAARVEARARFYTRSARPASSAAATVAPTTETAVPGEASSSATTAEETATAETTNAEQPISAAAHAQYAAELRRLQDPFYRAEVGAARREEENLLMHQYRRQLREFQRRTTPPTPRPP